MASLTPAAPEPSAPGPQTPATDAEHEEEIVIPPMIVEANAAYDRDLPAMLKTHPGQWVAYRGGQRVGFNKDDLVLYRRCREEGFGDDEFVVYCVEPKGDLFFLGPISFPFLP